MWPSSPGSIPGPSGRAGSPRWRSSLPWSRPSPARALPTVTSWATRARTCSGYARRRRSPGSSLPRPGPPTKTGSTGRSRCASTPSLSRASPPRWPPRTRRATWPRRRARCPRRQGTSPSPVRRWRASSSAPGAPPMCARRLWPGCPTACPSPCPPSMACGGRCWTTCPPSGWLCPSGARSPSAPVCGMKTRRSPLGLPFPSVVWTSSAASCSPASPLSSISPPKRRRRIPRPWSAANKPACLWPPCCPGSAPTERPRPWRTPW